MENKHCHLNRIKPVSGAANISLKNLKLVTVAGMAAVAFTFTACKGGSSASSSDSTSTTTTTAAATDSASGGGKIADIKPKGAAPQWGPDIKPQMAAVIEKLASFGDKPIPQLTAVEARKNHTAADAAMGVMQDNKIPMPDLKVDTMDKQIPVNGGNILLKVYTPQGATGNLPVIVYYHGGGFVIANVNVYDSAPRVLAHGVNAVVVSVAYRLAPENKFPTAHNDAYAAYEWVTKNAASIKGDPNKIAVAGESAGGNLAVATAIAARDKKIKTPSAIISVYPIAQIDMNNKAYTQYQSAKPLDKPMMMWFTKNYVNTMADAKDPRINLVAANLKGLPPVTIINAELDPLQDDGKLLEQQLKAAGVTVDRKVYDGVTHEFFGMGAVVPQAKDANDYAVSQLKSAFGK